MLRVMQRDEAQSTLAALRKFREALDIRGPPSALRKQFSNQFLHLPLLGMELRIAFSGGDSSPTFSPRTASPQMCSHHPRRSTQQPMGITPTIIYFILREPCACPYLDKCVDPSGQSLFPVCVHFPPYSHSPESPLQNLIQLTSPALPDVLFSPSFTLLFLFFSGLREYKCIQIRQH